MTKFFIIFNMTTNPNFVDASYTNGANGTNGVVT